MEHTQVITRFAPSPTGYFHVGSSRSVLFNYLFARKNGGKFILRIDDTDKERDKPEYDQAIFDSVHWLGLEYDESYRQSERTDIYKKYLEQLIAEDKAYWSEEEVREPGQLPRVIRFRNPGKDVHITDLIRGLVVINTSDLGDFVIAKDLTTPIYHFTSIVDDWLMGITHVIRGEEHLSNTPRQILLLEALGGNIPKYAHIPLIVDDKRAKLSKRKHGAAVWLSTYRDQGYLPEAMINFLALLGWSPQAEGIQEEVLKLEEIIKLFDLNKVQKGSAVFNLEKLKWMNKEHIKRLPEEKLFDIVKSWLPEEITDLKGYSDDRLRKMIPLIVERIQIFADITEMSKAGDIGYFFDLPEYDPALLKTTEYIQEVISKLESIPESDFTAENTKTAIWDFATEKGRGQVLWPMRVALTGREKSPDPFIVAGVLGKEETLNRLKNAIAKS